MRTDNLPSQPGRAFRRFFALGCIVVILNTPFVLGDVPAAHAVLSLLAVPGTLITLPLHDAAPAGGWGVLALIATANGLAYGWMASLVIRVTRR